VFLQTSTQSKEGWILLSLLPVQLGFFYKKLFQLELLSIED
jgi:hypothetical protein